MVKQLQVTLVIRLSVREFHHLMKFTYKVPKQHVKCFHSSAQTLSCVFRPELSHVVNAHPMVYLLPCLNFVHLEQFCCLK